MELRRSLTATLSMVGLRGDGGERFEEEIPQMGSNFLIPKLVNLLTPLSLFGAKRYLHSLYVGKFCHSFKNHHVNRRLILETCCEENKYKTFVNCNFAWRRGQRN